MHLWVLEMILRLDRAKGTWGAPARAWAWWVSEYLTAKNQGVLYSNRALQYQGLTTWDSTK